MQERISSVMTSQLYRTTITSKFLKFFFIFSHFFTLSEFDDSAHDDNDKGRQLDQREDHLDTSSQCGALTVDNCNCHYNQGNKMGQISFVKRKSDKA